MDRLARVRRLKPSLPRVRRTPTRASQRQLTLDRRPRLFLAPASSLASFPCAWQDGKTPLAVACDFKNFDKKGEVEAMLRAAGGK